MTYSDFIDKVALDTEFSAAHAGEIRSALKNLYEGSGTARKMFDDWIAAGKSFTIDRTLDDNAYGHINTGRIEINLDWLEGNTYISREGKAVADTAQTLIAHEFVHAVLGLDDNIDERRGVYSGDTVDRANQIFGELSYPEQVSYLAYDSEGSLHRAGYDYTGGATIDVAVSRDGDISVGNFPESPSAATRDLLIGGGSANTLISGAGDDFLFGAGGDDILKGDGGIDTAVYYGVS